MVLLNKIVVFLLAASFAARFVRSKEVDYCDVPSCKLRLHVMCEFPAPASEIECLTSHQSLPLKEAEKTDLLNWHNTVRSGVARTKSKLVPGGGYDRPVSNMLEMTWSRELERFAQRWAEQCNVAVIREHDECRNTMLSDKKNEAGQLVYVYNASYIDSYAMGFIVKGLKKEWTQEPLEVPDGENEISGPREWVRQVTWPSARTLGCGRSKFSNGKQPFVMVVCNYGVAVGRSGGPRFGEACTNCPTPSKCSRVSPGLCVGAAGGLAPALLLIVTGTALAFYVADLVRGGRD